MINYYCLQEDYDECRGKIIELLCENEPMRPSDIAEALEVEKVDVDKAIKNLKKTESIYSPTRCFYSVEK